MRRQTATKLAILAAGLLLVAAACGDDADTTAATAPPTTAAEPTTTLDSGRDDVGEGTIADVVITDVVFDQHVTLTNTGSGTVDISGLWLCNRPNYIQPDAASLGPGESVQVEARFLGGLSAGGGEVALYTDPNFGDSSAIIDYVAWGSGGGRLGVAESAGIWPAGGAVAVSGDSISAPNGGAGPDDWS